jgi:DUF1365 family protein
MTQASPSTPAIWLYSGKVFHARLQPFEHRFLYNIYSIYIDLGRLADAEKTSKLFSVNRFNLISFYEKDHSSKDGTNLFDYARNLADKADLKTPTHVWLSTFPRVFGYAFNPLSIYFLQDENGKTYAHLYEVRNTFGQMHTYIKDVEKNSITHSDEKLFHVSPFLEKQLTYLFNVHTPDEQLRFRIIEKNQQNQVVLTALQQGVRKTLNWANLMDFGLSFGFMSIKVIAGIHYEALKLYIKGARLKPNFKRSGTVSKDGVFIDSTEQEHKGH